MNWSKLISEVRAAGWTQQRIAARLGIAQSTVCKIERAFVQSEPRYPVAQALIALHNEVVGKTTSHSA